MHRTRQILAAALTLLAALTLTACTESVPIGDGGVDGSTDGSTDSSTDSGTACGATVCAPGAPCCADCDGNLSCGPVGSACAGGACPPPTLFCNGAACDTFGGACCAGCCGDEICPNTDGTCPDLDFCAAVDCPAPSCADGTTCGAGEQCCDNPCDGSGVCVPAGAGCPLFECPPPPLCTDGTTCGFGEQCCPNDCTGGSFCSAAGSPCPVPDCPPPPPTCADVICGPSEMCCTNDCTGEALCLAASPAGCPIFDCPPPPVCGGATCGAGEACCTNCDGSQFCSGPGATCPATPCPPPPSCGAQDAHGDGLCDAFFGYAWDGASCVGVSGCSCVGADCSALYMDPMGCAADHSGCPGGGTNCGGFLGATCAAGEFCDYPATEVSCGAADGTGTCTARPTSCSRVSDPVCGCDGRDYANECIAHLNGTDVANTGTCAFPTRDCRTTGCAAGSSCIVCGPPGSGFSCVPDGTACAL